jgi:predicted dehydrogenase
MAIGHVEAQAADPMVVSSPQLRVGVVGAGAWAGEIHVPVLCAHPGVSLVGIWNHNPQRAKALAEAYSTTAFDSYDAMLEAVDVVSFAVPPDAQPALAQKAALSGRHLLLEKPIAFSLADGEALVDFIAKANVASIVFFTRRFEAEVAKELAAIAEARNWQGATARFFSGAMLPGTPYTNSVWRQRRGALWDIGPHALSVLLPILGNVVAVEAKRQEPKITLLRLTHVNGGQSDVALSFHAEPAAQGESYCFRSGSQTATVDVRPARRRGAFHHAVDALITAAKTGAPHSCDVRFGLRVLQILVAAESSLQRGVAVPVVA